MDYSDQKQHKQHKHQQNNNNLKTKMGRKTTAWVFQVASDISHERTFRWLRKENLKREIESLLIAAQNNSLSKNYVKAKIDKKQENSKCRLCDEKDETINNIISKCRKLAQKEY